MTETLICRYAWVIPWNEKKATTITNAFQKILNESRLMDR